jgi:hypothetical protein
LHCTTLTVSRLMYRLCRHMHTPPPTQTHHEPSSVPAPCTAPPRQSPG